MAQRVKRLPAMQETGVQSLSQEDPLEKEMATHSSIPAWKIPWMEEPGRLQSPGSHRVGHARATSLSLSLYGRLQATICRLQVLVVLGQKIRSLPHGPLPHGCSQQSSSISQSSPLALRETERWRGAGGQRGRARQMPESLRNRTSQSASQNVGYVPSARSASPSSAHSREGITEGHKRQGSPWEPV